jgi:hypothetical protein
MDAAASRSGSRAGVGSTAVTQGVEQPEKEDMLEDAPVATGWRGQWHRAGSALAAALTGSCFLASPVGLAGLAGDAELVLREHGLDQERGGRRDLAMLDQLARQAHVLDAARGGADAARW